MPVKSSDRVWYHGQWCERVRYDGGSVGLYAEGCIYCQAERGRDNPHFPSHWASRFCQSGGRNHCTCDTCW